MTRRTKEEDTLYYSECRILSFSNLKSATKQKITFFGISEEVIAKYEGEYTERELRL